MVRVNSHTASLVPVACKRQEAGGGPGNEDTIPFLQTDAPKANIVDSSVTLLSMLIRS